MNLNIKANTLNINIMSNYTTPSSLIEIINSSVYGNPNYIGNLNHGERQNDILNNKYYSHTNVDGYNSNDIKMDVDIDCVDDMKLEIYNLLYEIKQTLIDYLTPSINLENIDESQPLLLSNIIHLLRSCQLFPLPNVSFDYLLQFTKDIERSLRYLNIPQSCVFPSKACNFR